MGNWDSEIPPGAKLVLVVHGAQMALGAPRGTQDSVQDGANVVITAADTRATIRVLPDGPQRRPKLGEEISIDGVKQTEVRQCGCGRDECPNVHTLAGWDPAEWSLKNFIFSAVKGPNNPIQARSFASGMYFALLSEGAF